jgi:CBS domain-containing protein
MSAGEYCNREVVVINKDASVRDAVNLLRNYHVGDVVVVESVAGKNHPIGILTDRDIVVEILAKDVDMTSVTVGDVMSLKLVTVSEQTSLLDTLERMRQHGVRRLPVVDSAAVLVGIITLDDLLELLAEQISKVAALMKHAQHKEETQRR